MSDVPLTSIPDIDVQKLTFTPSQAVAPQATMILFAGYEAAAEAGNTQLFGEVQALNVWYKPIKDKKVFIYYFGLIKYNDIFGEPHTTEYCIYLANPDTNAIGNCDFFNELD